MNKTIAFAATALLLASTGAYAASPRSHETVGEPAASLQVVGNPITENVGSHREAVFVKSVQVPFVVGALVPTTGANGTIQTANSLPSAPEIKGAWVNPTAYANATGQTIQPAGLAAVAMPGNAS